MAYARCNVIYHKESALPEDECVNTYHFLTDDGAVLTPTTASQIAGKLAAALYDAAGGGFPLHYFMSSEVSRVNLPTIKVYDVDGGSPRAEETMAGLQAAGSATAIPSEAALCLSYHADLTDLLEYAADDDDADANPERIRARARGRIFWGPVATNGIMGSPSRPSNDLRNALVDLGNRLLAFNDAPLANGTVASWGVYSREAGVMTVATGGWVDNQWDTQRRRGVKASVRTTFGTGQG